MTSKTSSGKSWSEFRQIYIWSLKKSRGMLVLLTLLLFMTLPMILLLTMSTWYGDAQRMVQESIADNRSVLTVTKIMSDHLNSYLNAMAPVSICLVLLFAIILCILLFSYMQNKRSVDLFHSLPVGRAPMLLGRWCAGLTVLFIPIVINFVLTEIIRAAYGVTLESVKVPPMAQMLLFLLMAAAAFTFSMFMAVCSGTTLDTVLSILGVNAGYPILILLSFHIAGLILPGLDLGNWRDSMPLMMAIAPYPAAVAVFITGTSAGYIIWWVILTLAILAGSVLLYQNRKSETAENNFAFPLPKIIIRFLLTAVGGLGLGFLLNSVGSGWFLFGIVLGSVLAHITVETIYSRGFGQLKKSFLWYGVFAVVFAVSYLSLATGFFGYDTRVPNAQDVTSVTVSAGDAYENSGGGTKTIWRGSRSERMQTDIRPTLFDKNNIQTVIDTQKKVVELYRSLSFPYKVGPSYGEALIITYHLKNGGTMSRSYQLTAGNVGSMQEQFYAERNKISTLKEYVRNSDMIFHVGPTDIKSVDVDLEKGLGNTYAPDSTAKQGLIRAIQQDLLNPRKSTDSTGKNIDPVLQISINYKDSLSTVDDFVKSQIGGYKGNVGLYGGCYVFYSKDSETYRFAQQIGWNK